MKCRRCAASFSAFSGRLTAAGVVCPRCQAADDLRAAFPKAAAAAAEGAAAGAAALEGDAKAEAAFRAFVEAHRSDAEAAALEVLHLRRAASGSAGADEALTALDAAMGWPADRPGRLEAIAALLAETRMAAFLDRLTALSPARAAAALAGPDAVPADPDDAWVSALRALAERGEARAAAESLVRTPVRASPRVLSLAAALARAGEGEAVLRWIGAARLLGGIGDLAPLLRELGGDLRPRALEVVLCRADEAEAVGFLLDLGEAAGAAARLGATAAPSAGLLALLRRRAADLPADAVAAALRRWAAAPRAPRAALLECALAVAAEGCPAASVDAAAEIAEEAGRWEEAAALRARAARESPTPGRTAATASVRERLLAFLRDAEAEAAPVLAAGVDLALVGDLRGAREVLDPLRAEPRWSRTLSARAAAFLRAAIAAVDLDVAVEYGAAIHRAARARAATGGAALGGAGETEAEIRPRARRFCEAAADLVAGDLPPFLLLPLPLPAAPATRAADRAAEAARRDRLEALRLGRDPARSETEFLRPLVRFRAANAAAVLATGGEEPAWGTVVRLDRAAAYGFIARRAAASLVEGDDSPEHRTAPRDLVQALLARAVAFVPGGSIDFAFDRWSRFKATFTDAYRVLGRDPAEIVPQSATPAAWDGATPADAPRAAFLPMLDAAPPLDLFRPVDADDPTRSSEASRLSAAAALHRFKI